MAARQAHNLEVVWFKSHLRNQLFITVSIQIGAVFLCYTEKEKEIDKLGFVEENTYEIQRNAYCC